MRLRVLLLEKGCNRVSRALTDLFVDPADILTHHTHTHQQHANEKECDGKQGKHSLDFRTHHQAPNGQPHDANEGYQRYDHARHREELQRHHRETRHQVEVEADQAVQGIFRLSNRPFGVHHLDFHRVAREGVAQRGNEGADLDTAVDRVHDFAVVATQHASLVGDPDLRGLLPEPVHQARGGFAPIRIVTVFPDSADVVGAPIHGGDDLADFLRGVLQVRIQCDDVVTAGLREPGHDGHVLSDIAREDHHARGVGTFRELPTQYGNGAVAATVIHEDHFVLAAELIEHRVKP